MDAHLDSIEAERGFDANDTDTLASRGVRRVVLDTETTGLGVGCGHRVIEIGCVELVDRRLSGREFHRYLNPERALSAGAVAVHGITREFLLDKPRFAEVVDEFLAFIDGSELLIHNAAFDTSFLDSELRRAGEAFGRVAEHANVVDTLGFARKKYPGQRNTLDALCERLGVDNGNREVHGALLDARLLADVWVAMTAWPGAIATVDAAPGPAVHARVCRRTKRFNAGKPWSSTEERELVQQASSGVQIRVLAKLHERTGKAIRAKLKKLGIQADPHPHGGVTTY